MKRLAMLLAALAACRPNLPPPSGCRAGDYTCRDGRPYVCSASARLEPIGDTPCAPAVCVAPDGGAAHCAPATDGGAP